MENYKVNRESPNRQNKQMTLKPVPTSGRFKVTFIYRHHNEPRVQLQVPKEETFPITLKYTDVTRSTYTDLDVMQEKRVDDCWNVHSNSSQSDSWNSFTKIRSVERKTSRRIHVVRGEIDKSSNAFQTRSCVARSMDKKGKAAQHRENKNGKTRSQNSRMLDD